MKTRLNLNVILKINLTILLFGLVTSHATPLHGQAVTSEQDSRATPAPWRPSFGSINKNAVSPAGETSTQSTSSLTGPQKLGPNVAPQPFSLANRKSANDNSSTASASTQTANPNPQANSNLQDVRPTARPGLTKVTKTFDRLPNSAGQVWREYDISPYTSRITTSKEPQKAVLDWILRETGTEMWFNEPLGLLHANKNQLYVYHTPEIQKVVKSIVDRFVWTQGQVQNIDVNLVTVTKPNWRSQAYTMLQPIDVKSPGVEAWMISKENAAILLAQLEKRGDFSRHSSGRLSNHDGQVFALEKTKPVQFVRNFRWVPNQVPNYQPLMTSLDEGYRLTISSLSSIDNETIEAIVKCDVDQVEKLTTVKVNVPTNTGTIEPMNLQVPQIVSWRLHERFRWPNDQVLLLSCGVVATPEPDSTQGFRVPGLNATLGRTAKRADALLFIDYRGPASEAAVPLTAGREMVPVRRN